MIRFILETGFVLFFLGAWGALWHEEHWQSPLVPANAKSRIQTVTFIKLQSNQNRYRRHDFIQFETTNGVQQRVELPKHIPCCLGLIELKTGSKIEISWSDNMGIDYLNIEGGKAEITPERMWIQYRDDRGIRWFLIIVWLVIAGETGKVWYKYSLVAYLTMRSRRLKGSG